MQRQGIRARLNAVSDAEVDSYIPNGGFLDQLTNEADETATLLRDGVALCDAARQECAGLQLVEGVAYPYPLNA